MVGAWWACWPLADACNHGGCTRWWCCFRWRRGRWRRRRDGSGQRGRKVPVPGAGAVPRVWPRVLQQVHPADAHGGPPLRAAAPHLPALLQGVLLPQLPPLAHLPLPPRAGAGARPSPDSRTPGAHVAAATPTHVPAAPGTPASSSSSARLRGAQAADVAAAPAAAATWALPMSCSVLLQQQQQECPLTWLDLPRPSGRLGRLRLVHSSL